MSFLSHHTRVEFGTINPFLPTSKHPQTGSYLQDPSASNYIVIFFIIVFACSIQCELWGKRVVNSSTGPKPCVLLIYTPHSARFRFSYFSCSSFHCSRRVRIHTSNHHPAHGTVKRANMHIIWKSAELTLAFPLDRVYVADWIICCTLHIVHCMSSSRGL